jgi:hypothetical protein
LIEVRGAPCPTFKREDNMLARSSVGAAALAVVMVTTVAAARAHDQAKYPDWSGQWLRAGGKEVSS